ncbi:Hypothetical predicted protein [Olea europaea subsp. europaea]|uniref:Uncharacterized protein n=2 Tax=Olea europaea subsp. europaea TaxID=158383 RepID=A0A8S0Q5D8_OLEEU|nr:Hypothetical predicted protein [Olea europaea subsp. europaea]
MVEVDSGSTIADEEESTESPPSPKVAFSISLIEQEKIQFRRPKSAVPPPQHTPWSMVAIRDYGDDNKHPTIIFPPINHENLQISKDTHRVHGESSITSSPYNDEYSESDSYSYSDSDSNSNSSATFSPSDSSAASASLSSRSPKARSAGDISLWFDSWVEILRSKVNNSMSLIWNNLASTMRAALTFRSAAVAAMLLMFLYFRQRRRLRAQEDSTNQLIRIIKEKDEKINRLLDQIAGMNQALLAFHRVPSSTST